MGVVVGAQDPEECNHIITDLAITGAWTFKEFHEHVEVEFGGEDSC